MASSAGANASHADTSGLDTLPLYKRLLYKNESDRIKYEKAVQTCLAAETERSQKNKSMTNGAAAKSNGSKASPSVKAKKTLVKKSAPPAKAGAKRKMVQSDDDDDDDDDDSEDDSDSESDSEDDDDDSEDEKPLASRKKNTKTTPTPPAKKAKKAAAASAGKKAKKKNASSSGVGIEKTTSTKAKVWDTLSHSGVLFPPQYEPHGISVRYSGQEVKLTPEQEEVATWYAQMIHTNSDYIGKELFQKNFWDGFKKILGKNHVIKELSKIDFAPIVEHLEAQREVKKAMTNEQKKELKAKKDAMEAPFLFAMLNGTREKGWQLSRRAAGTIPRTRRTPENGHAEAPNGA
ncbi:DNA topoisomerase I [Pycnococcus provasolii]